MIDTIRLTSPLIPMKYYNNYHRRLIFKSAYNVETDVKLYTFISGNLAGTWDSNISINLNLEEIQYNKELGRPIKVMLKDNFTITIELSIQKFMDGHNIGPGYDSLDKPLDKLFSLISGYFDVDLPDKNEWFINRIDIGFNFALMPEGKLQLFETYSKLNYPRRKRYHYQGSGLYFKGTTTTVKIYDKGKEFRKHDLPKLKRILPDYSHQLFYYLRDYADGLIRFEVEFHTKKLKDLNILKVEDYNKELFLTEYNKEVEKIMKIKGETIINKSDEILDLLRLHESDRLARTIYSTWTLLSTMDEEQVKMVMPDSTLRRHKKIMKDYGITWINSDFENMRKELDKKKDLYSALPVDFNFYYESKYKINSIPPIPKKTELAI